MPTLPSIADVLERLQVLELAVEQRDEQLIEANKRAADLASFRQEAITGRERLAVLGARLEETTAELNKAKRELGELKPLLTRLLSDAEENAAALEHARALASSVEKLNSLLGKK